MMRSPWSPAMKLWGTFILWVGIALLVFALRPLIGSLIIMAILAYLLKPIVEIIHRKTRLSWEWSVRSVLSLLIGTIILLGIILGMLAVNQFPRIRVEFYDAITALRNWFSQPIGLLGFRLFPKIIIDNVIAIISSTVASIPRGPLNFLTNIYTSIFLVFVVFISLYYFLMDYPEIRKSFMVIIPVDYREDIIRLIIEVNGIWKVFLYVQILIFFVLAALMSSGTLLVIWLFRIGFLSFSPILFILLIALVIAASQQVDNLWLRPQLMGRQLQLHPGVVFAALTGALVVSGLLGAFLVVPVIATAKVVGRYIYCQLTDSPPWPIEKQV